MIELKIKTATPAEQLYIAQQSMQIAGQTGYIGHLQVNKQGDSRTWTEHNKSLYTDGFQQDLEAVLHAFQSQPQNEADGTLDLRADTAQYSFLIHRDIEKDETVFRCYFREWMNRHMRCAEQGIRFITPDYKEKFRIPDGDRIRIQHSDGSHWDFVCRYIDETHLEVGNNLYHICQLAELMQRQGSTIIPLRSSLPERNYDEQGQAIKPRHRDRGDAR